MSEFLLLKADARRIPLADRSVQCCVCSPPYWGLRSYVDADDPLKAMELGCEPTPDEYVASMVAVFREVRRVLRNDGTLWIVIGDSYQNAKGQSGAFDQKQPARRHGLRPNDVSVDGLKPKDLVGTPWLLAFALRADGWWLRSEIIWQKPNAQPEPVRDRYSNSHEHIFFLTKARRYSFQHSGYEDRSVWTIPTNPFPGPHFATFPPEIPQRCIKAGSRPGDLILDPFNGGGTTGVVAIGLNRRYVGLDINPDYLAMASKRISRPHARIATGRPGKPTPLFAD